jgi:hypothetical protein
MRESREARTEQRKKKGRRDGNSREGGITRNEFIFCSAPWHRNCHVLSQSLPTYFGDSLDPWYQG